MEEAAAGELPISCARMVRLLMMGLELIVNSANAAAYSPISS